MGMPLSSPPFSQGLPPSNPTQGWLVPSPCLRALASSFPQDDWGDISAGPKSSQASLWFMRTSSTSRPAFSTTLVSGLNPSPDPASQPCNPGSQLSSRPQRQLADGGKAPGFRSLRCLLHISTSTSFLGHGEPTLLGRGYTGAGCHCVLQLREMTERASLL